MNDQRTLLEADDAMLDPGPHTEAAKALFHINATESPLLRMPPEIRNRIYTYTLGDHHAWYHLDLSAFRPVRYPGIELLRTCRQLYSGTRMLPFFYNTYAFYDSGALDHWVATGPSQTDTMVTIEVPIIMAHIMDPSDFRGLKRLRIDVKEEIPAKLREDLRAKWHEVQIVYV